MLDIHATLLSWIIQLCLCVILYVDSAHQEGRNQNGNSYKDHGGNENEGSYEWEYIIIGAGPAGLQMAYFLQQRNRNYVILERESVPGSFFHKYPRHETLISINKRFTGQTNKEFNLRHDWNSLLSHEDKMLYKEFSNQYFPHRDEMQNYLESYADFFNLNVVYDKDISNIKRQSHRSKDVSFIMTDQHQHVYTSRYLIIATGMSVPNIPEIEGIHLTQGYEDISTDPSSYEGKNVLILGHGNSAFETANAIYPHANLVHVVGRSRVRLSWETHYVGDVRAVNNNILDTYQLKSLDGVLEGDMEEVIFVESSDDGRIYAMVNGTIAENFALREGYDLVIRCLGFIFNSTIFQNSSAPLPGSGRVFKYPVISHDFQVPNSPGMYVVGSAAHSLDHRRSSGGFLHGIRYNVLALHRLLEWTNHEVKWPSRTAPLSELLSHIIKRVNEASGIYQMYTQLADVILINKPQNTYTYVEEYPVNLLPDFMQRTGIDGVTEVIVMVMQYGVKFLSPGKDVFSEERATGFANRAYQSNFLHPVLYYYKQLPNEAAMNLRLPKWPLPRPHRIHHIVEDFLTQWKAPSVHLLPLRRFLEYCAAADLRHFSAHDCMTYGLTHLDLPITCQNQVHGDHLMPLIVEDISSDTF